MFDNTTAALESQNLPELPKILIVDDDTGILNILSALLKSMECTVVTTADAFDAYAILLRSSIDLLIVDMRMPQISGLELIKKVKDIKPALRAILITAYDNPQIKQEANAIEGVHYIEKPFSHEQLKQTIRELGVTI